MEVYLSSEVQDKYLTSVQEKKIPIVLYTINGFQVRGLINDFDETSILLESEGKEQLVYKHAVSTIAPLGRTSAYERGEE